MVRNLFPPLVFDHLETRGEKVRISPDSLYGPYRHLQAHGNAIFRLPVYEEVADKVGTSCKSTISKSSKMLKNQGFSNVQSKISQRPGKIFQKFQKILRDHGLKRPFLALLVLGTIHVLFLRVFKLQSSDFFSKTPIFCL